MFESTLITGLCADCGKEIRYICVRLCTECIHKRVGKVHRNHGSYAVVSNVNGKGDPEFQHELESEESQDV